MHQEIVICLLYGKQLTVAGWVLQLCKTVSTVDSGIVTPSLNTLLQLVLVQPQTCHRIPGKWMDSFPK